MLYSWEDLLFSASVAAYVAVSVVVAAVRWGHKCEPYSKHMDYYYPAWKAIVWCYMSAILLVPCIFLPQDMDAVRQLRVMLILSSPFYCAVIMFTYFGKVLNKSWWRRPLLALAFPFGYMILTTFAHTLVPGIQTDGLPRRLIFGITGVLALVYVACFIVSLVMVTRAMKRYSVQNYSNPEDFPTHYASKVIFIPVLHIAVSWAGAIAGTKEALCIALLAQSVLNVMFLIGALSPHRVRDVEILAEQHPAQAGARSKEILKTLTWVVEEEQAFLDSHLSLATLSRRCGVNRTYLSRVMNDSLGGFFNYINRCRLQYADKLKARNPDMSVDDVAAASGFGSRQSYYNIRRSLNS